jgi:hypothetical protein
MSVVAAVVSVTAAVSASIGDRSAVVPATAIVATAIVGVAAVVAAIVTAVDTNGGIVVRIGGGDIRIGIRCWVSVRGHGRCSIAADSEPDPANSHADNNTLGEEATASKYEEGEQFDFHSISPLGAAFAAFATFVCARIMP